MILSAGLLPDPFDGSATAIYWNGEPWKTHQELRNSVVEVAGRLVADSKQCILYFVDNWPTCAEAFYGCVESGHVVLLADNTLPQSAKDRIRHSYKPHWIVSVSDKAVNVESTGEQHYNIYADLSVMLSTSGSTGSPKYVCLTASNLVVNALDISLVLNIETSDIAAAHLDIHYSYGLSVLTSHLIKGASVSFSDGKFTDKNFWQSVKNAEVTHLPGVPTHFDFMSKLQLRRLPLQTVTTLTQAGGRLSESLAQEAHEFMHKKGGRFYIMYGQTEASPRMSTLTHEDYSSKSGAVGKALEHGQFTVVDDAGQALDPGVVGEVVYRGENVMLGYAEDWNDLANGNVQQGVLHTGDLGQLDSEGFLSITGRLSRYGKYHGKRINLDEIETIVERHFQASVVLQADIVFVVSELTEGGATEKTLEALKNTLATEFSIPLSAYQFHQIDSIPKNARGKTDYQALLDRLPL